MAGGLRIRAAGPADKRAVREICARIWGDDYVLEVFDRWVRDRRGRLWVALAEERVVGFAKLTLVGREAWLQALRVDPRHRRQGVATALLEHRIERARRLGARVARLDTAADNVGVRRLVRRAGFHLRERCGYFERRAGRALPPRLASRAEAPVIARLAADSLIRDPHFVRRLTPLDVARAVREGRCVVAGPEGHPSAFAIVEPQARSFHGSRLSIRAVAGTGGGVRAVMRALPGLARSQGLSRVGSQMPSQLWPALRRAGYRRRWEAMLIFEREL